MKIKVAITRQSINYEDKSNNYEK